MIQKIQKGLEPDRVSSSFPREIGPQFFRGCRDDTISFLQKGRQAGERSSTLRGSVNLGVARTVPVPAARSQSRVNMTDKDLATTSSPQAFWIKKSRRALLSLSQWRHQGPPATEATSKTFDVARIARSAVNETSPTEGSLLLSRKPSSTALQDALLARAFEALRSETRERVHEALCRFVSKPWSLELNLGFQGSFKGCERAAGVRVGLVSGPFISDVSLPEGFKEHLERWIASRCKRTSCSSCVGLV